MIKRYNAELEYLGAGDYSVGMTETPDGDWVDYDDLKKLDAENTNLAIKLSDLRAELRRFFEFLNYTEESDSSRIFHPIQISNCRVMMQEPLEACIAKLKELSHDQPQNPPDRAPPPQRPTRVDQS